MAKQATQHGWDYAQVFPDAAWKWRFRIRAGNHQITATGEGYTRYSDAKRGARRVAPGIPVWKATKQNPKPKDFRRDWR